MEPDYVADFKRALVGHSCSIVRESPFWRANFEDQATIRLNVPWRIVSNGRVAFGNEDDGQWFGLPAPLDGERRSASLLAERAVQAVHLDEETGDLRIHFEGGTRIDVFFQSVGYEGWDVYYSSGGSRWGIIALGGGEIAVVLG